MYNRLIAWVPTGVSGVLLSDPTYYDLSKGRNLQGTRLNILLTFYESNVNAQVSKGYTFNMNLNPYSQT